MAEGKWISDLTAEMPLADAARRVLAVRLEVVRDYLQHALHQADKDPEYVHQLRVGTRRAGAALKAFADCLPEKEYRKARKRLRKLRRAAGAARDWDVFLIGLGEWRAQRGAGEQAGLDCLLGYALAQRQAAQAQLEAAGDGEAAAFEAFLAETVVAVRPPHGDHGGGTLVDLARPLLGGLLHDLEQAAGQDLDDYGQLHRVRIAGKRLRYAMEIFAECFAEPFRAKLYPAVEEMQEILGRANDSHVAGGRLADLRDRLRKTAPADWKRLRPGIEALLRHHQRRVPQERRRFLKWWRRWEDAGGEAVLAGLLKSSGVTE
jgi:CHAD domain-containing protein